MTTLPFWQAHHSRGRGVGIRKRFAPRKLVRTKLALHVLSYLTPEKYYPMEAIPPPSQLLFSTALKVSCRYNHMLKFSWSYFRFSVLRYIEVGFSQTSFINVSRQFRSSDIRVYPRSCFQGLVGIMMNRKGTCLTQ